MLLSQILLYTLCGLSFIFIVFLIKSKILERYFLIETVKPFFLCLFIITFIMMLDRLMELMNLIIEKQLDPPTIISLFALSLPFMFALSVPLSVLTSSIMAFGRMSVDQELTAAKSTGINIFKMTSLLVIFFLMVTVGMMYFNDFILPESNHILKNLLIKITYKKPITAIKPGTFTTMNALTIYARDRSEEALHDILIFNLENVRFPQTIEAKRGEMYLDPVTDQLKVILYDGAMYERDTADGEKYQISKFDQYTFYRSNLGYGDDDASTDYRGDREMTSIQMQNQINERRQELHQLNIDLDDAKASIQALSAQTQDIKTQEEIRRLTVLQNLKQSQKSEQEKNIRMLTVEIHKKYSLAVACFVFMLVGLPIGMMTKTSGIGVSFTFSSVIFVIYYISIIMGEEMGDRGTINPTLSMWLSAIIFAVVACFLIYFAHREKHFDVMTLVNWVKKIKNKIFRRRAPQ